MRQVEEINYKVMQQPFSFDFLIGEVYDLIGEIFLDNLLQEMTKAFKHLESRIKINSDLF